jgi:hypothetical protein
MEKLNAICAAIREEGLSDGAAGARAGVPHTTLSRWKAQDEEVEMELVKARALYQCPRLEKIAQARRKDGTLDWRAQSWLVKFAAPEEYGRPSRRRRLRDVVLSDEERSAEVVPSSATAGAPVRETKNVTFSPEIPSDGARADLRDANAAKDVTLSPETPRADPPDAHATKSVSISPEIATLATEGVDSGRRPSASDTASAHSVPDLGSSSTCGSSQIDLSTSLAA